MKNRVITHMNADHASSLKLFLQHYNSVPARLATNPKLDTIALDQLTITTHTASGSSTGRYVIPLNPPLSSWSEARDRMVSMHHASLAALGLSDIAITAYVRPRGFQLVVFVACAVCFVSFPRRANFAEKSGGLVYSFWSVFGLFPGLARFAYYVQPYIVALLAGVHAFEVLWLGMPRLKRHRVEMWSPLWWKWVSSNFVEGVGATMRMDALVREGEEKKRAGKH